MANVPVVPVRGPNNLAAFYSFLRVLAVAECSALLPLFLVTNTYPTLEAMGLAMIPAFLLTVINYFRAGEVRFGAGQPNVERAHG